jgi:hypothetical protein
MINILNVTRGSGCDDREGEIKHKLDLTPAQQFAIEQSVIGSELLRKSGRLDAIKKRQDTEAICSGQENNQREILTFHRFGVLPNSRKQDSTLRRRLW